MSTLKADTIQSTGGGAATLTKQHAAKAWALFDQVSVALDSSFNIASTVDEVVKILSYSTTNKI